jgi:phosphonate utilization associated putative membrane protein
MPASNPAELALSWPIMLLVLGGAALHAGWNALIKSSGDKEVDTALIHFLAGWVALPVLLLVGLPPLQSWPFIAASLCVHIGYYTALAGAYKHGELGLTYPIMRGFAPLLVALVSGLIIGEAPTAMAWLGIGGITVGVALVGLAHPGEALHHGKALAFAFSNAAIIALYTVIDGVGVRSATDAGAFAMQYVMLLFVLDGIPYPALILLRRDKQGRAAIWTYAKQRWPVAALAGSASIGSYAIALWAMTRAPVASVAALRETSVLFAVLLGCWMLKERFGLQRALGTLAIVLGVMALRLA